MGNYATQPDFATEATAITPTDDFTLPNYLDGAALFVGSSGDVNVIMRGVSGDLANTVVFANVPSGTFLPVIVDYVTATDTSAALILAIK